VPLSSTAYIPRLFEQRVFGAVTSGRWVLLLGPRQHGKSSGLVRLNTQLRDAGYTTAVVDLQGLPPCPAFPDLLRWFSDQIGRNIRREIPRPRAENQGEVGAWLEAAFPPGATPVAVIIDEAGSIENPQFRNAFYGQIRQISTLKADAAVDSVAARIRFVFAGTFRPETLVQEQNSPFNVCQTVYTDDITLDQATQLANSVNPTVVNFVRAAHELLNGQPYLLQTVFQDTLSKSELPIDVAFAEALQNLPHSVNSHLEGIFSKIVGNTNLVQKVAQMVQHGSTDIAPADSDCAFLQVIGLAKRDAAKLVFRSAFYEKVAKESPQLLPAVATIPAPNKASVYAIEKTALAFMTNVDLREICFSAYDGAAKAHGNGSYRLALTGFGSAMEALLVNLHLGVGAGPLQIAVNAAKAETDGTKKARFNHYENEADPLTWRLVNLINVAQKVRIRGTYPEPSHALREWRNLVHPALAMKQFVDESKLELDSVAASVLFLMLLRDINP
jgi:hypothetical protein